MSEDTEIQQADMPPERPGLDSDTVQRAVSKLSSERPTVITEMMGMVGSMANPLQQKMNEGHITQALNLAVQHDQNEFKLKEKQMGIEAAHGLQDRVFHGCLFLVFVVLLVITLFLFRHDPTVLLPILTGVGGLGTGFVGGMGYSRIARGKSESD